MTLSPRLFFLLALFLFLSFFSASAQAADSSYLSELVTRAKASRLSEDRIWRLFLHYSPRLFGGVESEVDDPTFFLAPNGKTSPEAELAATLDAFFRPPVDGSEKLDAQCRFVSRYRWLKERLSFDPARLPERACPDFEKWRAALDAESITLVFASYYVNNPASMFGHTLLRLNRPQENSRKGVLEYALNYAANTGSEGGIPFAVKGLMGGYQGEFALYPYYFKIQEYGNSESRDLWEYKLSFSKPQVTRVVEHLWEIGHTYFDYYFFDENCSYHLLSLLEVADPNLRLRDRFHFFVAPSDTVRAVTQQPGLVVGKEYRPSLLSRLKQKLGALEPNEKELLSDVVKGKESLTSEKEKVAATNRRALVGDAAIDYLAYKKKMKGRDEIRQKLLVDRAEQGAAAQFNEVPQSEPPELGHESSRVGAAFGLDRHDEFTEFRFRGAYHDLLAQDRGNPRGAEIEGLRLALRFYFEEARFWMEDATLVNLKSVFPADRWILKPSWNVAFGMHTERNDVCGRCNSLYLKGGSGLAVDSHGWGEHLFYAFANAFLDSSPWSNLKTRIGPRAEAGWIVGILEDWKVELSGLIDWSPIGGPDWQYSGRLAQRISLSRNTELRLEGTKFQKGEEGLLAFQLYF